MEALVELPGVGRKTANVVLGHALGVPGLPVDRHVLRVANRIGIAQRAVDMICEHARQRVTFGAPLADRQTIQWWVADAATQIHACRLMVYDAACKIDRGRDARSEVSMIKVFATELAWDIIDKAMQTFGAMGMAKEIPLQLMASKVRLMRIYDGPSEVHRWVIARNLLGRR